MLKCLGLMCALVPGMVMAQDRQPVIDAVLDTLILPGYAALETQASELQTAASENCDPADKSLRAAFHETVDAWMPVAHFRFGPSEVNDRAFAMAFWPDTKGFTEKALRGLIQNADPIIETPEGFSETSIAGRGLFAMERLLFDPAISEIGTADYRCALVRSVADDALQITTEISYDWKSYQTELRDPGPNGRYRDQGEALRALFNALSTGLEFNADMRLGRPMGSFDRPRAARAEMRRSQRSLPNVMSSMSALHELALTLSSENRAIQAQLSKKYYAILEAAQQVDAPDFFSVTEIIGRFRVEVLQQAIKSYLGVVTQSVGPYLGVSAGFNALDGD